MKRFLAILLVFLLALSPCVAWAAKVQEISSPSGVKAWLAEDHTLPIVAVHFAFRGGVEQDPVDKQGLAVFSMNMLTEGAGAYDAEVFQKKLADHSITLRFSAGRDALTGQLRTLSADRAKAFELLRMALMQARFDEKDCVRKREEQLVAIKAQSANPDWQARYALFQKIYGDHPYGYRSLGSLASAGALTCADARAFVKNHFARDNLLVSIAGDMTPDDAGKSLDLLFASLPEQAALRPVPDFAFTDTSGVTGVDRDGAQTDILFALPGPKRGDEDLYAAEIANYIVGGGGFSSRLMQAVRSDKGLTYGISTSLAPMTCGGLIAGDMATANAKAAEAWQVTLATLRQFHEHGPTDEEIQAAKDYLTGAYPLAMTSVAKIAAALNDFQLEGQSSDYLERRAAYIRAVTPDDVRRVVRQWFDPAKVTAAMVGKPEGITFTSKQELVRQ